MLDTIWCSRVEVNKIGRCGKHIDGIPAASQASPCCCRAEGCVLKENHPVKSVEEVLAERQAQLQGAYGSSEDEQTRKELLLTIQKAKRQLALLDKR